MDGAEDDTGGLFAIEVSSEDEATQSKNKQPRDFQSEEDFQHIKATYKPKVETGEVIPPPPFSSCTSYTFYMTPTR